MTLAAVLFCGCDEMEGYLSDGSSDELLDEATLEVSFSPAVVPASRVTSDVFDIYDEILVSAVDAADSANFFATNVPYTYRNGFFSSESPITYTNNAQELRFLAAYPATVDLISNLSFTVSPDQNVDDNYEMSDLLLSATDYTSDSCPYLDFYHAMTSIVVDITTDGKDDGVLTLFAKGTADIDLEEMEIEVAGEQMNIIAASNGTASYKAIFAPQTIAAGEIMATYEIDGEVYEWALENTKEFATGCRYYVEWDLDENTISFESYINGWEDGDNDDDYYVDVNDSYWFEDYLLVTADATSCYLAFDYAPAYSSTMEYEYSVWCSDDWVQVAFVSDDLNEIQLEIAANESGSARLAEILFEYFAVDDSGEEFLVSHLITVEQEGMEDIDAVTSMSVAFSHEGGVEYLDISDLINASYTSDIAIGLNTAHDWFTVDTNVDSSTGDYYLEITAEENNSSEDRTGYFTILIGNVEYIVYVSQHGESYSSTDVLYTLSAYGDEMISLECDVTPDTKVLVSEDWLEAIAEDGYLTVCASANTSTSARYAEVCYSTYSDDGTVYTTVYNICQEAAGDTDEDADADAAGVDSDDATDATK